MSDTFLRFVPHDPAYVPGTEAANKAAALLASFLPGAEVVKHETHSTVVFVDPGENWSGVACPAGGADAAA